MTEQPIAITISGRSGSGKSTVAEMLANHLHVPFYSIGNIRRSIAKKLNLTIEEFNLSDKEGKYDKLVDNFQKKLLPPFVLDSRLGFYFQPNSLKLFIDVDYEVAAKRIFKDQRSTEKYSSEDDVKKEIMERDQGDSKRFLKLYRVSHLDLSHYDFVINSSYLSPDEVLNQILDFLKNKEIL